MVFLYSFPVCNVVRKGSRFIARAFKWVKQHRRNDQTNSWLKSLRGRRRQKTLSLTMATICEKTKQLWREIKEKARVRAGPGLGLVNSVSCTFRTPASSYLKTKDKRSEQKKVNNVSKNHIILLFLATSLQLPQFWTSVKIDILHYGKLFHG